MLKIQLKPWLSAGALGLLLCGTLFGQPASQSVMALLDCVDNQYGSDDYLVNGEAYQSANPRANGFANFLSGDWIEGTVYVQGKTFKDASLKYDLAQDVLALKQTLKSGAPVQVVLNPNMVDSFQLADHLFLSSNTTEVGYGELIYQGRYQYLQKHRKRFVTDVSIGSPYGKYIAESTRFYIFTETGYQEIARKRDLLSFFENHKKEIKKYLRQENIKLQKASGEQLYQLFKYVDGLL